MGKIMTIENTEVIINQGLPRGFTAERSQDFGGDLVIRENGVLAGVSINGDELGAFRAVFPRREAIEIFNSWKNSQTDYLEGGE